MSPASAVSARADRFQFLRFLVAAGLSVPVNLGSRLLFSRVMPYEAALVLSQVCGMLTAYALTRALVFKRSGRSARSELGRFALVNVYSGLQTWVVAVGLVRIVFPWLGFRFAPEFVGQVTGLALSAVTSFFAHRAYSFEKG